MTNLTDDEFLAQVLFDLAERRRRGEAVDLATAMASHPQHAAELERLFPTIDALARLDAPDDEAGDEPPAPAREMIGDYQLIREIGRGGMGIVYEARQLSLNRRVALKVLPFAAALDQRALARFKQESLAAAQLDHPHIVHVYNVGVDRGIHYYAMQFIDGQSLAQVIDEMKGENGPASGRREPAVTFSTNGCPKIADDFDLPTTKVGTNDAPENSTALPDSEIPIPKCESPSTLAVRAAGLSTDRAGHRPELYRAIARLGIQAAEALDYAHEHGILHRDVKPGNLLLDENGKIFVTDFGLARIETADHLTHTGDLFGTLRYMSPEQALGERGLVDQRGDVYSLGATLYELLTLHPAFPQKDRARLLLDISSESPRPLHRFDRSIPGEFETIVLKCLEKEPADRYPTAAALADNLGRYLANKPLKARRAGPIERLRKWSRRHQLAVMAAAVTISLSLSVFGVSALWVSHARDETATERHRATQEQQVATDRQAILRRFRYVSKIHMANTAWKRGDLAEVRRQLSECNPKPDEEDLRGFEWHWLSRSVTSVPPAWRKHRGAVNVMRFTRDGRHMATAGHDGIRIWSWPGGDAIAHLTAHATEVDTVDFSPDGTLLASAGGRTVRIWDTNNWSERRALVHQGLVIGALFSPDGQTLAYAERFAESPEDKITEAVRLWDVATGTEIGRLSGPVGELHALAWSPDGASLATGASVNNELRIWDPSAATVQFAGGMGTQIRFITFAHQRPVLAVAHGDGTLILDSETRRAVQVLPHAAESVIFSADDRTILTAGRDGTARLWKYVETGDQMVETCAFRESAPLWCAAFSPDEKTIITGSSDGSIRLWNRQRPGDRAVAYEAPAGTGPIEFGPDGKSLFVIGASLQLVDCDSGSTLKSFTPPGEPVCGVALSADGKWLAAGNCQGRIDLWNLDTGGSQTLLDSRDERMGPQAFLPGPHPQVVVSTPTRMFVVSLSGVPDVPFPPEMLDQVSFLAVSPDARAVAALGRQFTNAPLLSVWDAARRYRSVAQRLCISAAFSPDGRWFAAGDPVGVTTLWQTDTWEESAILLGPSGAVNSIAFSPDGRTLAISSTDKTIRLWNTATGRELLTFDVRLRNPDCLRFSRDGRMLACCGQEDSETHRFQVLLWRADIGD